MEKISKTILSSIYKKRGSDSRKYDFGYLLVIGGSRYYSGAPFLGAMAAMRAGCDMVRVIAPEEASGTIAAYSPNLSAISVEGHILTKKHLDFLIEETIAIQAVSRGNCAVLIGGGISRSPETMETVAAYLSQIEIPAVVDAEAIHALVNNAQVVSGKTFLLTPHAYEFFILTGKKLDGLTLSQKEELVKKESARLKTTILLKGKVDLISDGNNILSGHNGNALMTKGGLGDTLAGIAGAIMARKIDPLTAGAAAAFINGAAGEAAGRKFGEGLTATDLIEMIPGVLPKQSY
jgi:NAD(P)H-hydrate epimerase